MGSSALASETQQTSLGRSQVTKYSSGDPSWVIYIDRPRQSSRLQKVACMEVLYSFRTSVSGFIERLAVSQVAWLALLSAISSIVLTALLIKIATIKGWVVVPSQNRWSKRTVAQFGGGPVLFAFWLIALMSPASHQYRVLLLSTVALALLGLIDDIKGLGPKPKLLAEVMIAACAVSSGIVSPITHNFSVNWVLTVLWIVVISNAFNIIDNMDGLAGGVAIIGLAGIALLAGFSSPIRHAILAAPGFRRWILSFNFTRQEFLWAI